MSKEKQIEEMAKEIADVWKNKCQTVVCKGCKFRGVNENKCQETLMADHLYNKGYRKRSENTIELLCKVSDTVYQVDSERIYELEVFGISIVKGKPYYETESIDFDEDAIGKSVFLTREEAEAKMKGGAE